LKIGHPPQGKSSGICGIENKFEKFVDGVKNDV
jgi:hypothetical protein